MPASRTGIAAKDFKQCDPEHQLGAIGWRPGSAINLVKVIQEKLVDGLANGLNVVIVLELLLQLNKLLTARLKRRLAEWCFFERRTWLSLALAFWIGDLDQSHV